MAKRDYYEVLGIQRDAGDAEIKRAYRKLAMKYHPDRNSGDDSAQEHFKEAQEAYEVLKSPQKRSAYDQFGHAATGPGARGPAGFDGDVGDVFGDIFGDIVGGRGGRGGSRQQPRGSDRRFAMERDLEDAVTGITREFRIPSLGAC